MNKKNKTIRVLENKASKNNLNALFQLAQYYEQGQYVDKDKKLAGEYYTKVLDLFSSQCLKISSLKLIDFRIFKDISIDFHHHNSSNLTVIVGNNGAGKTTLLEAIEKHLSCLTLFIKSKTNSGSCGAIDQFDIHKNDSVEYSSIISNFTILDKSPYKVEISNKKMGSNTTKKSYYEELRLLAEIYKYANSENSQFSLPIMAFYSVKRANEITNKDTKPFDEVSKKANWNKFDGYNKALNEKADFKLFFQWFKYNVDIHNANNIQHQSLLTDIAKLQAELDSELVHEWEKKSARERKDDDFLISFKRDREEKVKVLEAKLNSGDMTQSSQATHYVTKAIYACMPDFKNLRIQHQPLDMLIDKNDVSLSVLQLSQGEKSLLALVGDIARRLVLLNPSLENPLEGNGIVLIDEIDLHLHPLWQQSVLPHLTQTFSNIQFIVTTHSPQVLTTVNDKNILILKDGKIYSAPKGSKGAKSSRLLKRIFDVDVRPPNDANTQNLDEYKKLVYSDDWESSRAQELRLKLDIQFGDEEPDLTELDLYIENREWEIEIEKNQ